MPVTTQQNDEPNQPMKRAGRRGCGGIFLAVMMVAAAVWGAALGAFVWILEDTQASINALEDFRPKVGSRLYSWDGELLGEFTTEARQLVSLSEMPLHLQQAFIATEDKRFYSHVGVRPESIVKAVLDYGRTGSLRGASTITQQVVRNVEPLGVGQERKFHRKIREAIIALQVERQFTKDEILELYLNQIFLGVSAYGVEAASQQYFGKSCRDVSVGEAALLAGLTRSPNGNQPFSYPENAKARRDIVLAQMLDNQFITEEECAAGLAESVEESVVTPEERAELIAAGKGSWNPNRFKAPYFSESVRVFLMNPPAPHVVPVDTDQLFEDGLEIHTSLDMHLQRAAEAALLKALDEFDAKKLATLERQGKADEFEPVSGALVCIDNRPGYEGFVRAMVGGRDFDKNKFNTATQARRQPGSSVKPFVWAAALDNGFTAADIVYDEPFRQLDGAGNVWAPQNFDGKFGGAMTLRTALEKSVNIVAIKLVKRLGMPLVRSYLHAAGIRSPIDDVVGLTIALGTPTVTVLEHCTAYSTFANGGVYNSPVMVTEIKDRDGFSVYNYRSYAKREQAIPADVAYAVTYLMEGVAQWGTGSRTRALERPRAGKTGTTNDNRDVWFCGFTPDFTCVVWVGYRDNRSLGHGREFTGGHVACPVWTEFMIQAEEGLPVREFAAPAGADVKFHNIDKQSGLAGGSFREVFIRGTKPPSSMPVPESQIAQDDTEKLMEEDILLTP